MKIVLISDVAPSDKTASGHVLSQYIRCVPGEYDVYSIVIGDGFTTHNLDESNSDYVFFTPKPNVQWSEPISQALSSIAQGWTQKFETAQIKLPWFWFRDLYED